MPAKYEAIRDRFISKGMGSHEAKTRAAKIYNAGRKPGEAPVSRNYELTKAHYASRSRKRKRKSAKRPSRTTLFRPKGA